MELEKKDLFKEIDYISIIKSDEPFNDKSFVPDQNSLFSPLIQKLEQKDAKMWKTFIWSRPIDLFNKKPFFLFSNITPYSIIQGSLSDCYYISALSALAENPDRIKKLFLIDKTNPSGCYPINIFYKGEQKTIIVDDYFPFDPSTKTPAFSRSEDNDLWVLLLEKCWAKVNESYENIISGHITEAFHFLTGSPTTSLDNNKIDKEKLWEIIKQSHLKNYIVVASANKSTLSQEDYVSIGLISEHSYTILSSIELTETNTKILLIKIRNPWGHLEWKGDWSDSSELWTPELMAQAGMKKEEEGVFFMCIEDYIKYYRNTVICKINESFIHSSYHFEQKKNSYNLIYFQIDSPLSGSFSIAQPLNRLMVINYSNYEPSEVNIILAKILKNEIEFIEGSSGNTDYETIEIPKHLENGEYLLFIEINWLYDQLNLFNLSTYTDKVIKIEKISNEKFPYFLNKVLSSCAKKRTNPKDYSDKNESKIKKYISISDSKTNYGYIFYENKSSEITLNETLTFKEFKGLTILPPNKPPQVEVVVEPNQEQIIVLKKIKHSASLTTSFICKMKKSDNLLLQEIEKFGKKIQFNDKEIYMYSLHHDYGYILSFQNNTEDILFQCKFKFDFENLEFDDSGPEFEVRLKPGENQIKKLKIINLKESSSYKLQYFPIMLFQKNNPEDIEKLVKEKGNCKILKSKDGKNSINYYVFLNDIIYYWLFENASEMIFEGEFLFKLTNLQLKETDESEENKWTIKLQPKEKIIKTIEVIDQTSSFSYQLQCASKFISLDKKK